MTSTIARGDRKRAVVGGISEMTGDMVIREHLKRVFSHVSPLRKHELECSEEGRKFEDEDDVLIGVCIRDGEFDEGAARVNEKATESRRKRVEMGGRLDYMEEIRNQFAAQSTVVNIGDNFGESQGREYSDVVKRGIKFIPSINELQQQNGGVETTFKWPKEDFKYCTNLERNYSGLERTFHLPKEDFRSIPNLAAFSQGLMPHFGNSASGNGWPVRTQFRAKVDEILNWVQTISTMPDCQIPTSEGCLEKRYRIAGLDIDMGARKRNPWVRPYASAGRDDSESPGGADVPKAPRRSGHVKNLIPLST
ncbi:hypothetical protein EDD18DRAFT_1339264 [Armillaria luteobubalina]|uniref:Uncharacterized protein n=1 Tax=Armillaria luteobubalina TaxID=153913 RepID=A0AA39UDA0_9AGAR|nr:hypothetical protein EDD18DRAFT_1339264 [Armillaria luteobubalina]